MTRSAPSSGFPAPCRKNKDLGAVSDKGRLQPTPQFDNCSTQEEAEHYTFHSLQIRLVSLS
eukprot:4999826-Amphidinium_carterae.3